MSDYLHCRGDGTAVVSSSKASAANDISVLPYVDSMKVIVRVVLADDSKRYTTVSVGGLKAGVAAKIVDVAMAGAGAQILSFERATSLKQKVRAPSAKGPSQSAVPTAVGTGGTPDALWVSGIRNVPTVVPPGHVAFLVMNAVPYDAIEVGAKRCEYRKDCKKYVSMLLKKNPVAVRLQYGYTHAQMVWEVTKVRYKPVDGFEIYLGRRYS